MSYIDSIDVGGVVFDIKASPIPAMATIETGTTATRAYAIGDYVIIGTQLYQVTAAIAIGDEFEEGVNISSPTSLANEITALSGKVPKYEQLVLSTQSIASGSTATITGTGSYNWLEVLYFAAGGYRCCTKVPASANVNIPLIKSNTELSYFSISAPTAGVRTITNDSGITLVISAVFGITF